MSGGAVGVLDPQNEERRAIVKLNDRIQRDDRVENVLLPVRDGLMLARKKPSVETAEAALAT
jgi:predicted O-methyltransferase YrrM